MLAAIDLPALAGINVSLAWNPSADSKVAGYKIYFGTVSHAYTNSVDVANVTNATIVGLPESGTYYFAAKTYDEAGNEGDFSNEATNLFKALPPTLNPIGNLSLNYNSTAQTVNLSGISPGIAYKLQPLIVTAISSNPILIPTPTIYYSSPNSTGTLTLQPAANARGACVVTVTVNNGGASNNLFTQTFTVTVNAKSATGAKPLLLNKLADQVVLAGKTISLKISASGKAPLKYQWVCNGTNLPGATSPSFTLKNVTVKQAGLYSVTVNNSAGSTNSTPAALAVYSTPAATLASPTSIGGQFTFQVVGVTAYTYAVQVSGDLVNWTSVQTNMSPFNFEVFNATQFAHQYYRTVYLP